MYFMLGKISVLIVRSVGIKVNNIRMWVLHLRKREEIWPNQLFELHCLAKDHWRGFSTRNAHMVHIVNLIRLKMVLTS